MVPTDSRRALSTAVLAVLLIVGGGISGVALANPTPAAADAPTTNASTPADTDTNESDVVSDLRDRIDSLETVTMTQEMEVTTDGDTITTTTQIWADLEDTQLRQEVVDSEYQEGVITVRNESTTIIYDPDDNTVQKHDSRLERVLPTVKTLANESIVEYDYVGDTEVNGQTVHKLSAEPLQQPTDADTNITVLVDPETNFPVQLRSSSTSGSINYTSTLTFTNVTLDAEIPDSRFEIDIPENATEPDLGPEVLRFDSIDSLQSAADLSVPDPDVPSDYSFERGRIIDGDSFYSVSLSYSNGTDHLTVSVQADESPVNYENIDSYEQVQIGDETGWYASYDGFSALNWDCGGQAYSIYGSASKDTVTDVAASIDC